MAAPIHIFLRTESDMRRELWRTFLSNPNQICLADWDELTSQTRLDVVLTDQPMDESARARFAPFCRVGATDAAAEGAPDGGSPVFFCGVIEIGVASADSTVVAPQDPIVGPSSVSLPVDATARELKMAVLLLSQIVRLHQEITARDPLNDQYQQLAFQDPLTSIANRRAWDQELEERWDARLSAAGPLCLALLDVDQLKQVNDALGHPEGDAVLRAVAEALVASVRDEDFVARLGGDEFGILLEDVEPAAAARIVDRIRRSTSRYLATGTPTAEELPVTTSAGFACLQPNDSLESLLNRADEALRAAKKAGSNITRGQIS